MKTAKKLILFIASLTIACMIILLSCHNRYTGPNKKGIFEEEGVDNGPIPLVGSGGGLRLSSGYVLPSNSLSQSEQNEEYDPEFNSIVLFKEGSIPALTITSNGFILAAVGTGENANHIVVKRSSDMGKTWYSATANTSDSGLNDIYTHPFFINCHDGSVLMGIATTNYDKNKTTIYKSSDDGATWTKKTEIELTTVCSDATSDFVTYGQGLTLRHQSDKSSEKLLFPYFYSNNNAKATSTKGRLTATMCSTDGGASFSQLGSPYGSFTTYETKFVELSDGNILLHMISALNQTFWMISYDCGDTWTIKTKNNEEKVNGVKHVDLVRYEFNGKPIRYEKDALMIYGYSGNNYGVKMTTNDFNNGVNGQKYHHEREDLVSGTAKNDGYPAITVLPDGTIATLTEEDNGITFRRFNLNWLTDGIYSINYESDLKFN